MVRLEPRGQVSKIWTWLSPAVAIGLTLLSGVVIFSAMGKDPAVALYIYFVQPVTTVYGVTELLVKATPLVLIGIGLAIGFRANVWNIGAEGQLTIGAIFGSGLAIAFYQSDSMFLLPGVLLLGVMGGMLWGAIPALLKTRFNANEILTSLMLTYVAGLLLSYLVHGPWRDPDGFNFPESRLFPLAATLPVIVEDSRLHLGALFALLAVVGGWILIGKSVIGFQLRVVGQARCCPPRRVQPNQTDLVRPSVERWAGGTCRGFGSLRHDRPTAADDLARLRLHRHHRRLPGPAASGRRSVGRADHGAVLSRRRGCANRDWAPGCGHRPFPRHPAFLPARLRCAYTLSHPGRHRASR